ncbi:MAG: hypothetical protein M3Y87_29340, partial [Myxococcota bacterium]|nr:hypothetical protein [Myxococcota bacterium]
MMRIALLLVLAVIASACGGTRATSRIVRSAADEEEVASIGEASLTIVPRASEGRTWMSLWIDAGSRDST